VTPITTNSMPLDGVGRTELPVAMAQDWLSRCACAGDGDHALRCELGVVIANCDIFGETVETEFERIQNDGHRPQEKYGPATGSTPGPAGSGCPITVPCTDPGGELAEPGESG
jgi:hypothetical protein